MKIGSLFSGAGLGDLGWLMSGMDIRWQCEIDEYCQKILELRFLETRKYRDVKKLTEEELEPVDIVAGGFPCQPFSVAGKQRGDQDDRNLWPPMLEVIKKVRPTWVVGENVSGIIPIYLDNVLADLESEGYACRTFVFPAHALGASHRRERIWIVGYSTSGPRCEKYGIKQADVSDESSQDVADPGQQHGKGNAEGMEADTSKRSDSIISSKSSCEGQPTANTDTERLEGGENAGKIERGRAKQNKQFAGCDSIRDYWSTEPSICRVVNGCSSRVDRLKALGNGQVVAATAFIGQLIMEFEGLK